MPLLDATAEEREEVAAIIATHQRLRPLLHGGEVIRVDHPEPEIEVHGVVAADWSEAVVAVTRLASGPTYHAAPVTVPGLDPGRRYGLVPVPMGSSLGLGKARSVPAWLEGGGR